MISILQSHGNEQKQVYLLLYYILTLKLPVMNKISSATLRSALAIVLGFILVLWPSQVGSYLVITVGILFILPGIFSLLSYFTRDKKTRSSDERFPIEGAGSILFGAWLVIMPYFFIGILMYVLGGLLVLAGLIQIISLIRTRKWSIVPWGFYVFPVLILLTGIILLVYPFEVQATTFIIFGVASIIYGFTELINSFKFRRKKDDIDYVV